MVGGEKSGGMKAKEESSGHPLWLEGKRIQGVADPAIWEASHGESIAETAEKYGIYFDKGDHKRLAGWMQMHYRLQFDEEGIPMMYIFSNCKGFIRTIPLLRTRLYRLLPGTRPRAAVKADRVCRPHRS